MGPKDEGRNRPGDGDDGRPEERRDSGSGQDPARREGGGPERSRLRGEGGGPPPTDDPDFLARFKEFPLTSFAVGHRTSVVVLFFFIAIMGLMAYQTIPREAAPEIEIPIVAVNTIYAGVSPSDIETLITRPLEDELHTISEIDELTSTSVEGYSSIIAEFSTGTNMDEALAQIREKVDLAKPDLPSDAEDPSIVEFNTAEFPIMQVNLAGEYGLVRLKDLGEELQDRLEQIPEVLRADLSGGLEREVRVDASLPRLKYYGLALSDVVDAIRNENVNVPGGSIEVGSYDYLVRVDGEFVDPSIIEDLVVSGPGGRAVYVRDLARVDFGFAERTSYARLNGVPVVTLDVVKRSGANIIETADAVKAVIAEMEEGFPPTTQVSITGDQSQDIHAMVSTLENSIISGLLLIVAILFFFLGIRTSIFVALAIPTSMLLSFVILGAMGVTLNMVVLFSLILALGMLVDNAIVIVENIYRFMEEGWSRGLAAVKATGEVALPVIGATATTLAAFTPLLFWPDVVGEFMGFLPLTLIVTLSSSLFVALVILPTLCALFMTVETESRDGEPDPGNEGNRQPLLTPTARWTLWIVAALFLLVVGIQNPLTAGLFAGLAILLYALHHFVLDRAGKAFQARGLPWIIDRYEGTLQWALNHRFLVVGTMFAAFVLTVALFARFNHGVEFFPEGVPPQQAWVNVDLPVGSRAGATDRITQRLEAELPAIEGYDDVESVVATVGGSGGGMMGGGGAGGTNQGRITLSFLDYEDRKQDSFATLANLQRDLGRDVAGADISVDRMEMGPPQGPPVNIEIAGPDPAVLQDLSNQVLALLRNAPVVERLDGLESDLDEARSELSVQVDRERAALYGLSTQDVGWAIRGAIEGTEAAKYRTGNDEFDIMVRLAPEYRSELSALQELNIVADDGSQVPLVSVANWEVGRGLGSIRRKDMDRMVTISSEVQAGYNQNAVLGEVREALAEFGGELPPGYQMRYTGQVEEQTDAQEFLTRAFLIALMLIGFILVSQFNSVVKPVIILTSVIMSTMGVLLGLMFFEMPFVIIMTGVGIISLAGIVVNNAIVLIDYIDILRERDGMDRRQALVEGGKTRFRPVMLTAITTALGLVPLAIGLNLSFSGFFTALDPDLFWGGEQAAWWGPMAIAVIVGILFATVLTLLAVPVMYSLVDDFSNFFQRHFVPAGVREEAGPRPAAGREPAGGGPDHGNPGTGELGGAPSRPDEGRSRPEPEPVLRRLRLLLGWGR